MKFYCNIILETLSECVFHVSLLEILEGERGGKVGRRKAKENEFGKKI